MEKNLQLRMGGSRKRGKFSIVDLISVEKTRVRISIIASGLRSDQKKPRNEFRYLSLNSLSVRFFTSSLYSNNDCAPHVAVQVEMLDQKSVINLAPVIYSLPQKLRMQGRSSAG